MAKSDIGLYVDEDLAVMVPKTERAIYFFREDLKMPEDCDGLDVTEIGPYSMLALMPRYFTFMSDKKEPKKTHKYLYH